MQISIDDTDDENEPAVDVTDPKHIQILIREDGKTIWINSETHCLFRACRIGTLSIDDQRPKDKRG